MSSPGCVLFLLSSPGRIFRCCRPRGTFLFAITLRGRVLFVSVVAVPGFKVICCQESLHGSKKRGGWGGRGGQPPPPPHLQTEILVSKQACTAQKSGRVAAARQLPTECSHGGFHRHWIEASLHGSPSPVALSHNARIMGFTIKD